MSHSMYDCVERASMMPLTRLGGNYRFVNTFDAQESKTVLDEYISIGSYAVSFELIIM